MICIECNNCIKVGDNLYQCSATGTLHNLESIKALCPIDPMRKRDVIGHLFNAREYKKGVEIGVQKGLFSETIRSAWKGKLHLVDNWKFIPDSKDISNVSILEQNKLYLSVVNKFMDDREMVIHRMDSIEAALMFPDDYFDWIYIDADHSFEGCSDDLKAWWPKLRKGGLFAGHDYMDGEVYLGAFHFSVGVKSAVEKFVLENKLEQNISNTLEQDFPSWYFLK